MKDPTLDQINTALDESGYAGEELATDRAIAIHYFAEAWHSGAFSNLYAVMCAIDYNPKGLVLESESELTQQMFGTLERYFNQNK